MNRTRFFGYPSDPPLVGQSIEAAVKVQNAKRSPYTVKSWPQVFRFGEFIDSNVLGGIDAAELCYFDVSVPNFNVFFEAGYAFGRGKPTIVTLNNSLVDSGKYLDLIGLFDNIGQLRYSNSVDLTDKLLDETIPRPVLPSSYDSNASQPLYVLKASANFEGMARALSALTETFTQFRSFDPTEDSRMSLRSVLEEVAQSTGVLCAIVSRTIQDAESHNLRAAFLSGAARAMDRELLLLNMSTKALPLDVRDFAKSASGLEDIQRHVQAFALTSLARLQRASPQPAKLSAEPIQRVSLGAIAAENEEGRLANYFVETTAFRAAMTGEARIIVGRKGSGKTAIFLEMSRQLQKSRKSFILSLRPEGYQLKKFKDKLIGFLEAGTKEHTVAAFWEYLLLLEICHRCIEDDSKYIGRDPHVSAQLPALRDKYGSDEYILEADFSERTLLLLNEISQRFSVKDSDSGKPVYLSRADLTELIYSHDIRALRDDVLSYLSAKDKVVVLIDNLDKGWESDGVSDNDLLMLRALIDVGRKIERKLNVHTVPTLFCIFLRNDVYERLLDDTPDRGKEGKVQIDWTDRDSLKKVIRERLAYSSSNKLHWGKISQPNIEGKGSLDWAIDRCLMRPRYLIDLVSKCMGAAAARGHARIESEDFRNGYEQFSLDALVNTNLEIRDVQPLSFDAIFALLGLPNRTSMINISLALLARGFLEEHHSKIVDTLIWYGVLGIVNREGVTTYIYDVQYSSHVLEQFRLERDKDGESFEVNPAFWPALRIRVGSGDPALPFEQPAAQ